MAKHFWQIRIYDAANKLVDLPQADVESIDFEKGINGGSGAGTITFRRPFNSIGAIGFGYQVLIWIWNSDIAQPANPYYAGYIVDFDQNEQTTEGQIVAKTEGWFKLLDRAIVTGTLSPGLPSSTGGPLNPSLDAGAFLPMLLTTYQPASFGLATIPASMFNLQPTRFDATKLGAAIDTITKQGRDSSGRMFIWSVPARADLYKSVIVQPDQNPNTVPGVLFKHLFKNSQLDQYTISTKYRDIVNTVAVYGGKDPQTGQQVFGDYLDQNSVNQFTPIEDKITVPALLSVVACQAYASIWLDLHAYPQAQGSFRLLDPDPTIDAGTWVQIWETSSTIKQVRVAMVKVTIKGERIEQVPSTVAPVPYLDHAVYRMGLHVAQAVASAARLIPVNAQSLFIRSGGAVTATASNPAQVALSAVDAIFPAGEYQLPALGLTQLVDNSGGPNNGQGGDGAYWISAATGATPYIITKGKLDPPNITTQQNLVHVVVVGGVPICTDVRNLNVTTGAVNGVITHGGTIPSSTPLNPQGSLLPYTTDAFLHLKAPAGGTSIQWWIDNGNASTDGHFFMTDGSQILAPFFGTAGAPAGTFTGLVSGNIYYVGAWRDTVLRSWTVTNYGAVAPTNAQIAAAYTDGRLLIAAKITTPSVGGGGGGGGGGGPPRQ